MIIRLRAGSRLSSTALFGRLLLFRVHLISVILNKALEPISCHDIRVRRIMHWLLEGVEIEADVDVNADQVTLHINQWSATVTPYERSVVI